MSGGLRELAALHGIAPSYHDIWGNEHEVPPASLVALLGAMGVDAQGDAAIESALAAHESERWRTIVDAAIVLDEGAEVHRVRINLPSRHDDEPLRWRVDREEGPPDAGRLASVAALPAAERASCGGVDYVGRELVLALVLPAGYHRLAIDIGENLEARALLIVAPAVAYRPPALEGGGKVWGTAIQLYGVRSERNSGIGDYSDLGSVVEQWGRRGAGIVGVSPLHALFPHDPARASPYGPSSRLFKNVLYIDVEAVPEFRACAEARRTFASAAFQARLKALRETEFVDYPGVAAAKGELLALLYAWFRERELATDSARARAYRAFVAAGGEFLHRHVLYEALQEHWHRDDPAVWGWPAWPEPYRDPASAECARFAEEHADRLGYFAYLQWLADAQLFAAGRRAFELGLGVGLCEDLAIAPDRGGAEAWSFPGLRADRASIGAPPDDFSLSGQDWGLPPPVPARLRAAGYLPFIESLRANMRHAGALRIDHVMGLSRLFWVPPGGTPADGAYVRYPASDLLRIVALESHRNRCLVIGEDLGTVPDELRDALTAAGLFSYRVLFFERHPNGDFRRPVEYPGQALAVVSTHDLPTLAGWWEGRDLAVRSELAMFPDTAARDAQVVGRAQDRARLLLALEREGLLPAGATVNPVSVPDVTPEFTRSIVTFLGQSAAQLLIVQAEDVLGVRDQANLPGTTTSHPNWMRKLPLPLERWPDDERFVALTRDLAAMRQRHRPQRAAPGRPARTSVPRATYRLQLHRDFDFAAATAVVPYLAALGVSHVYCSPYLRARPGSRHGYDIVDHAALNPEIGNEDGFDAFVAALEAHGLGQIADVVPNHMGVMGADNAWWMDVLENGPASPFAEYFDIDWAPIDPSLAGKVLVPALGDHYGNVLERGELVLAYEADAGSLAVRYFEHRFPIDPREYPRVLGRAEALLAPASLPREGAAELASLISAFGHLPPRGETGADAVAERSRDKEVLKRRLAELVRREPAIAEAIERTLRTLNGTPGERASFVALDALFETQAWRVAYWRVAAHGINYRRFFDINDLAALRMERDEVFEATHRYVLELAASGRVAGLRIDHVDGLLDPAAYFRRLQERYRQLAAAAGTPADAGERPLYVVIEKIVARHERLPERWPVHGTTGYDFANSVNGLLVDGDARSRIDRAWRAFVRDEAQDFDAATHEAKRAVMRGALAGELTVLANRLLRLARADWRTRDFTFNALRQAIAEVVACFPVYRTYIAARVSAQDRRYIDWAVAQARRRSAAADPSVFDFLREALLANAPDGAPEELAAAYRNFAMRFQQLTSPVTAKGVEDTALYVFNRLVSLNDVGGDPEVFGTTVAAFHRANANRAAHWPHALLATSTHDSKRSEDVRARIDVISERPAAWRLAVRRWSRMNRSKTRSIGGAPAPSRNDEYLLYQTLAGTFPAIEPDAAGRDAYCERIEGYIVKAVREAKVRSSWINPDADYEAAATAFVRALLEPRESNLFLDDFRAQAMPIAWFGALNSLSMTLLKLASPGVPDIYQGQELIELALVDPDNRRAVDFGARRQALDALQALEAEAEGANGMRVAALLDRLHDGRAKLWMIRRALALRSRRPELFAEGDYVPLAAAGARAAHVVAFARRQSNAGVVTIAGRLFASLGLEPRVPPLCEPAWGDTTVDLAFLPEGTRLENVLTGESLTANGGGLRLAKAFAHFPGALLAYET